MGNCASASSAHTIREAHMSVWGFSCVAGRLRGLLAVAGEAGGGRCEVRRSLGGADGMRPGLVGQHMLLGVGPDEVGGLPLEEASSAAQLPRRTGSAADRTAKVIGSWLRG